MLSIQSGNWNTIVHNISGSRECLLTHFILKSASCNLSKCNCRNSVLSIVIKDVILFLKVILHVFRSLILFLGYYRISLHALALKKHTYLFLILCLKRSALAPVTLSSPPKRHSLLWLVSSHMPEPAQLTTTEQLCKINSYAPNDLLGITKTQN